VVLFGVLWATDTVPAQAAENYDKAYTVTGRAHVRVHADDASVHVITSDSNQVEFHARSEGAAWGIEFGPRPHVESHQDGDLVELNAQFNWHFMLIGGSNKSSRIEVRMPRNADLDLDTGDGSVELSSLNGNVTVHTSDGGIHATQVAGSIELHTSDGNITANGLQGAINLHTSDGHIRGSDLEGRCEASSSDGSIEVQGRFELLDLHSGDGSITAKVEPGSQVSSSWNVHTSDGSVHLSLPSDLKASLDASTGDGRISSQLPVQIEGRMSKHELRGTLNGGGQSLFVRSGDGPIVLVAL